MRIHPYRVPPYTIPGKVKHPFVHLCNNSKYGIYFKTIRGKKSTDESDKKLIVESGQDDLPF